MLNNCLLAIYYLRLLEEFPYVVDRKVYHEFMPGSFHKKPLDPNEGLKSEKCHSNKSSFANQGQQVVRQVENVQRVG